MIGWSWVRKQNGLEPTNWIHITSNITQMAIYFNSTLAYLNEKLFLLRYVAVHRPSIIILAYAGIIYYPVYN